MPKKIVNDDFEIDLVLFLKIVWKSKLILIFFNIISLILATCFIYIQEPKYQSEITLIEDTYSPFYDSDKQLIDFKKLFYDKNIFNDWYNLNNESSISYDLLNNTNLVNDVLFLNSELTNFISINSNLISIKTNDTHIIDDVYNYSSFVNITLKDFYLNIAKFQFKSANKLLNQNTQTVIDFNYLLHLERFITEIENGSDIFIVNRPILPYKTSFNSIFVYIMSLFTSSFIAVLFIIYRSYKNN